MKWYIIIQEVMIYRFVNTEGCNLRDGMLCAYLSNLLEKERYLRVRMVETYELEGMKR